MKKYVYENATVYITIPTEEQKENIKKATERFVRTLAKEGLLNDYKRQSNRRTRITNSHAGRGNKQTKEKDTPN